RAGGRESPTIPPSIERYGGHRAVPGYCLRPAISWPFDAAERMVDKKIPITDGVISRNGPRGVAHSRARTAGRYGLLDGRRHRTQGRRRLPGRAHRDHWTGELGLRR